LAKVKLQSCRNVADLWQNTEFLVDEDGVTFSNTLPALVGRHLERQQIPHSGLAKIDSNRLPLESINNNNNNKFDLFHYKTQLYMEHHT